MYEFKVHTSAEDQDDYTEAMSSQLTDLARQGWEFVEVLEFHRPAPARSAGPYRVLVTLWRRKVEDAGSS